MRPFVTVWVDVVTPRISYACEAVFGCLLGWGFNVREEKEGIGIDNAGFSLSYSSNPMIDYGLRSLPHGLLSASGIAPIDDLKSLENDELAAVFWLVTHYAAYSPNHPKDAHGRPVIAMLSSYPDPLDPVCHRLAHGLRQKLEDDQPEIAGKGRPWKPAGVTLRHTLDIDNAYAYAAKGPWRWIGSLAKDVLTARWKEVGSRLRHALGKADDPYDTHPLILERLGGDGSIVFFLMSDTGKYDRSISPRHPDFGRLVTFYKEAGAQIGLHPSYGSGQQKEGFAQEKTLLEGMAGEVITQTRYHYLRLLTPHTQRLLIEQGIVHDYSCGPIEPGFWQGISTPFPWFDVERNERTGLMVHPAAWMDVHWHDRPSKGLAYLKKMKETLGIYGGALTLIWHNDYFRGYADSEAFDSVINTAQP